VNLSKKICRFPTNSRESKIQEKGFNVNQQQVFYGERSIGIILAGIMNISPDFTEEFIENPLLNGKFSIDKFLVHLYTQNLLIYLIQ